MVTRLNLETGTRFQTGDPDTLSHQAHQQNPSKQHGRHPVKRRVPMIETDDCLSPILQHAVDFCASKLGIWGVVENTERVHTIEDTALERQHLGISEEARHSNPVELEILAR